ncbi:MAG: hypothetical protein ACR2GH_05790 [Pseudonocardia sp.]
MTTPPRTEHKVRQHENDIEAIYDLLTEMSGNVLRIQGAQLRQGSRLDQIEERLHGVEGELVGVVSGLAGLNTRVGGIEGRLTAVETQLTALDTHVGGIEGRLTAVEGQLTGMDGKLDTIVDLLHHGGAAGR